MRTEILASYCTKFDSSMAAYVYDKIGSGALEADRTNYSALSGESFSQIGRRVLAEDSQGFVELLDFATAAEADAWMDDHIMFEEGDAWIEYQRDGRWHVSCDDIGSRVFARDGYPSERRARAALRLATYHAGIYPNVWVEGTLIRGRV